MSRVLPIEVAHRGRNGVVFAARWSGSETNDWNESDVLEPLKTDSRKRGRNQETRGGSSLGRPAHELITELPLPSPLDSLLPGMN